MRQPWENYLLQTYIHKFSFVNIKKKLKLNKRDEIELKLFFYKKPFFDGNI